MTSNPSDPSPQTHQSMREIVSVHTGQCGIQIGHAFWELISKEHHIDPQGHYIDSQKEKFISDEHREIFFSTNSTGESKARAIFLDLDPMPIWELQNGAYNGLFDSSLSHYWKEDTGGVFDFISTRFKDFFDESFRRLSESCDNPQGFHFTTSTCGGTGSGLTASLLKKLKEEFPKKDIWVDGITYAEGDDALSVYNTMFAIQSYTEHADLVGLHDNDRLFKIAIEELGIAGPTFIDINRIVARYLSNITAPMRSKAIVSLTMPEMSATLIPYPRIKYYTGGMSPYVPKKTKELYKYEYGNMTAQIFNPANWLLSSPNSKDMIFGPSLLSFRGNPGDINFAQIKITVNNYYKLNDAFFRPYLNISKLCMTELPTVDLDNSEIAASSPTLSSMICANFNQMNIFSQIEKCFNENFKTEIFVQHYLKNNFEEGNFSEGNFSEAKEGFAALKNDYKETFLDTDRGIN